MDPDMVQLLMYAHLKNICLIELEAKAGPSRNPIAVLESIKAHNLDDDMQDWLLDDDTLDESFEDLCDLELSLDNDSRSVSSDMTPEYNEHKWSSTNCLRSKYQDRDVKTFTIFFFRRHRRAGDTIWFRVWQNGDTDFRDREDTEILEFVQMVLERNPTITFHVKTTLHSFRYTVFQAEHIERAMRMILERGQVHNTIVVPTIEEIKREQWMEMKQEKKGKPGYWGFLLLGALNRMTGNRYALP